MVFGRARFGHLRMPRPMKHGQKGEHEGDVSDHFAHGVRGPRDGMIQRYWDRPAFPFAGAWLADLWFQRIKWGLEERSKGRTYDRARHRCPNWSNLGSQCSDSVCRRAVLGPTSWREPRTRDQSLDPRVMSMPQREPQKTVCGSAFSCHPGASSSSVHQWEGSQHWVLARGEEKTWRESVAEACSR